VPLWAVFVVVNLALMFRLPGAETIPFHFVWISTALVYGLHPWELRPTCLLLLLIGGVSALALAKSAADGAIGWAEETEVPLMAALFLAMVWHVRRRLAAASAAEQLAECERRLRERQRELVRFAAHELRTPVLVARGHAELIGDEYPAPDVITDSRTVVEELDKLDEAVGRLVTMARLEEHGLVVPQQVDVDALLERCVQRWRAAARRTWVLQAHGGVCRADPARLEVALDSLLENAVRHTEPLGTICLCATRRGGQVLIQVCDDGLGFAPGEAAVIFDCFTAFGARRGTGLGLAIARTVVEGHGGTVSADGAPGQGAVFTLRLPANGPPHRAGCDSVGGHPTGAVVTDEEPAGRTAPVGPSEPVRASVRR
jgi:signal transduction histidine kinase